MNNLKTKLGIGILVIFAIGALFIVFKGPNVSNYQTSTPTKTTNTTPTKTPVTTPAEKTYTMTEVSAHNTGTSCWTTINGNVYDVTSWINQHPGGAQAILSLCGNDGTSAFSSQHGGQRRPEAELSGFIIGKLK